MKQWFLKTKLYFKKSRKNMEDVLAEKKPHNYPKTQTQQFTKLLQPNYRIWEVNGEA